MGVPLNPTIISPEIFVGVLSVVALSLSLIAYRSFNIVHWKRSLRYIIASLALFTVQEFLLAFSLLNRYTPLLRAGIELLFVGLLVLGIKKLHETASTLGV